MHVNASNASFVTFLSRLLPESLIVFIYDFFMDFLWFLDMVFLWLHFYLNTVFLMVFCVDFAAK